MRPGHGDELPVYFAAAFASSAANVLAAFSCARFTRFS
jgi:hypothetical protein